MNQEIFGLGSSYKLLNDLDKRLEELTTLQIDHKSLVNNFNQLEEGFQKKMGFVKSFVDEIQVFVNKLERRVLRIEHSILFPFGEESNDPPTEN